MLVSDFIRDVYLPYVKQELRPSTCKGYKEIFEKHLKPRLGDTRRRDVPTVTDPRLVNSIDGVGHRSFLHIKSFLSGALKYAKRQGVIDGENPVRDTAIPRG